MKIKLVKGLSFMYKSFNVKRDSPIIECSKSDGDYLVSTGYFVVEDEFEKMTKSELIEYANSIDVDVPVNAKKDEIIKLISKE